MSDFQRSANLLRISTSQSVKMPIWWMTSV